MADIMMSVLSGVQKRLKDMGDGTVAEVVYNANASGGGSGGGSSLADTLLTDTNGVLFVARDTGSAITYARVDTGAAYTPVAPIQVADSLAVGTDNAGVTQPAGGAGLRGWLSGIYGSLASLVSTANGKAARVVIVDPSTGNGSLVQAFHNADNQALGATSYGVMTGGVDQLLNGAGTLDRKRGVSGDAMPATGLAAEVPMLWNGASYDRAPGSAASGMKVTVANLPSLGPQLSANASAVTIASDQTVAVNAAGVSTTGSIAALNAAVTLNVNGASGVAIDLRGTFVATVTFQGSVDGVNWTALPAQPLGSLQSVNFVTSATAQGAWLVECVGCVQVRAIATAFTSGSVTAVLRGVTSPPWSYAALAGTPSITVSAGALTGALPNGANLVGDIGVEYRANATGAASVAAVMSPATPSVTSAKASAGRLLGVMIQNSATSLRSIKFWNAIITGITLGTTSALFEIDVPAGGAVFMGFEGGIGFSTAISYAVTGAKGLTDATAAGLVANDLSGTLIYA